MVTDQLHKTGIHLGHPLQPVLGGSTLTVNIGLIQIYVFIFQYYTYYAIMLCMPDLVPVLKISFSQNNLVDLQIDNALISRSRLIIKTF